MLTVILNIYLPSSLLCKIEEVTKEVIPERLSTKESIGVPPGFIPI